MYIQFKYLFLLVAIVVADKQIKLEDIERDNLISERRANQQEALKIEQTQHLRTPGSHGVPPYQPETSAESVENDLNESIIYAQSPTASSSEEYTRHDQPSTVQYVTPQQYEKDYQATPTASAYTHPVHEATHTYSAAARESLINPIIPKPAGTQTPYLSQQPRYVYVQAGPQQISQNGILTYGPPQHAIENAIQQQQKNAQDDVNYASIDQNHIQLENSQQASHSPNRGEQHFPSRVLQYIPLLAQNPGQLNYVMFLRNPSHASAYNIPGPSIQYAQPVVSPPHQPESSATPQNPTITAYIPPTVDGSAVLAAPESTAIPAATIQYAVPSLAAQQIQFHPLDYGAQHLHSQQFYPFPSPIDIYGSLNIHKQPASLLDSYIPSSVILAAQRQRSFAHRPHPLPSNFGAPPQLTHSASFYPQGSHQPGYNTIAYSTAQGYSKRSPKLVNDRPLKLNKIN